MTSCGGAGVQGSGTCWVPALMDGSRAVSEEFSHRGAGDESEFARLRNGGTIAENGEVLLLDRVENFLAAAAEEIEIDGQFAIDFGNQRKALAEPVAGALNFKLHHRAESGSVLAVRDLVFADIEAAKVFERKIDAALGVVGGYVLPEVGELQRRAGEVGKLLALGIAISAEVEDEMADGIRGILAIGQQVVESFEARDGLILAEGDEQVREFVFGNVELADGFGEGDEYGMSRNAFVAGVEFELPLIQKFEGSGGVADLVARDRRRCGSRRRR